MLGGLELIDHISLIARIFGGMHKDWWICQHREFQEMSKRKQCNIGWQVMHHLLVQHVCFMVKPCTNAVIVQSRKSELLYAKRMFPRYEMRQNKLILLQSSWKLDIFLDFFFALAKPWSNNEFHIRDSKHRTTNTKAWAFVTLSLIG